MKAILIVQEGSAQEIAGLALALQGQRSALSPDEATKVAEQVRESLTEGMELKGDYQL